MSGKTAAAKLGTAKREPGLTGPECVRLLNSSPLGSVITTHKLRTYREAAGGRLGPKRTQLVALIGWLYQRRLERFAPSTSDADESDLDGLTGYEAHRERNRANQAAKSRSGRDIAPLMQVTADRRRRGRCRRNLKLFCTTYFPSLFKLKWSKAHLRIITAIESAVLDGGQFAVAMPRGSGKSTIAIAAVIWATVYGHRRFTLLVNATEKMAQRRMKTLKKLLTGRTSAVFAADFPEVTIPFSELEGRANRAAGQLINGVATEIEFGSDVLSFPIIPGSKCSGSKIAIAGLLGEIRGHVELGDEDFIRPELVILDDPQTRESAHSAPMTAARVGTITGDIMELCGPDETMSLVMPCTVIQPNDVADQFLNPDLNPDWHSERVAAMTSMPDDTALDLWQEYRELLIDAQRRKDWTACNHFYRSRRKDMERGAAHYWPERKPKKYRGLTALQYTMEIYLLRPKVFWAEHQQQPEGETPPDFDLLSAEDITLKQHAAPQGIVPRAASVLTAFVDVQKSLLYWSASSFQRDGFSGFITDYQAHPQQATRNFHYREARHTLDKLYRGRTGNELSPEVVIRLGLFELLDQLRERVWVNEDSVRQNLDAIGVDCSWSPSTTAPIIGMVRDYNNERGANVHPMFGRDKPLTGKKKPGDRRGSDWRERLNKDYSLKYITHRPNRWKSFLHARFATDFGERGSLSLFADEDYRHETFAAHMRAEARTKKPVDTPDGTIEYVDIWNELPGTDNHWLDTVVGCHVLAEYCGCKLWTASANAEEELDLLDMLQGSA